MGTIINTIINDNLFCSVMIAAAVKMIIYTLKIRIVVLWSVIIYLRAGYVTLIMFK